MRTTDDPNVLYDEEMDQFVFHGSPEGCYVLSGDANKYMKVTQFAIRDLGYLVNCDNLEIPDADA